MMIPAFSKPTTAATNASVHGASIAAIDSLQALFMHPGDKEDDAICAKQISCGADTWSTPQAATVMSSSARPVFAMEDELAAWNEDASVRGTKRNFEDMRSPADVSHCVQSGLFDLSVDDITPPIKRRGSSAETEEVDNLRLEVSSLREQIQKLNTHMLNVMEAFGTQHHGQDASSKVDADPVPSTSTQLPPVTAPPASEQQQPDLATDKILDLEPISSSLANTNAAYSLALAYSSLLSPLPYDSPAIPVVGSLPALQNLNWDGLIRQAQEQAQEQVQEQPQQQASLTAPTTCSAPNPASTHHHAPMQMPVQKNTDWIVRQTSMLASQARSDLLGSFTTRIARVVRSPPLGELNLDSMARAFTTDIQNNLQIVDSGLASLANSNPDMVLANSEAAAMYRVEILKFITKELPRSVQEAVDKGLSLRAKKALNRSLLASLVQCAQRTLETHMHSEPASAQQQRHRTDLSISY